MTDRPLHPTEPLAPATSAPEPVAGPLLRVTGLTKTFAEVRANDSVSLEVRGGEIHCLLGENGAGKSTLIGILAGVQRPDAGAIEIEGEAVEFGSPKAALAAGIAVVYQHSTLNPAMTVAENLMLGAATGLHFWLDRTAAKRRLEAANETLGSQLTASTRVADLSLEQRRQLEIAQALLREPRLLILDEPTSVLAPDEATQLMQGLRKLAARGVAILLVSHKMNEVLSVADTFTVLRAGAVTYQATTETHQHLSENDVQGRLLSAMFGAQPRALVPAQPELPPQTAPIMLEARQLSTRGPMPLDQIDLQIRAGEIVGIAGIDGHGQRQLAKSLAGEQSIVNGQVLLRGTDLTELGAAERRRHKIGYVTDDRLGEGIVGDLSVAMNLVLRRIGEAPYWWRGIPQRTIIRAEAERLIEQFDIRCQSPDARAANLSGGNIQKLLLARELASEPDVMILDKPSQGLDVNTVAAMWQSIERFRDGGGAALVISTELDELVEHCNRIGVLSQGRIVGWASGDHEHLRERVGALMSRGLAA